MELYIHPNRVRITYSYVISYPSKFRRLKEYGQVDEGLILKLGLISFNLVGLNFKFIWVSFHYEITSKMKKKNDNWVFFHECSFWYLFHLI